MGGKEGDGWLREGCSEGDWDPPVLTCWKKARSWCTREEKSSRRRRRLSRESTNMKRPPRQPAAKELRA